MTKRMIDFLAITIIRLCSAVRRWSAPADVPVTEDTFFTRLDDELKRRTSTLRKQLTEMLAMADAATDRALAAEDEFLRLRGQYLKKILDIERNA